MGGGQVIFGKGVPGHRNQMSQPYVDGNYQVLKGYLSKIRGARLLCPPLELALNVKPRQ